MSKKWLVQACGAGPIASAKALLDLLLEQRGVAAADKDRFFDPVYDQVIHDPFLLHDMEPAVSRLQAAIKSEERIVIFGDYDLDGISGTALLVTVLEKLGAHVMPLLPDRVEHGYGLNLPLLSSIVDQFDLLMTVDCGVSNVEEIAWIRSQGRDVIVVDHHTLPEQLPEATAIVHPAHPGAAYPFAYLSGSGVAWKLASALLRREQQAALDDEKWLLDFACLGTLADVVQLLGENRAIVQYGLRVLARSERPGLRLLLDTALRGGAVTGESIAFRVAPLLNAAGRMDHPQPALDLLLTNDGVRAEQLLAQLQKYNRERRAVSQRIQRVVEGQFASDAPIVFASNAAWPPGVVGLVANRLSERYARPAFVVGGAGDKAVGSVRAPAGVNVLPLVESARDHLLAFGGHPQAAGFSLQPDKLAMLEQKLMTNADEETMVCSDIPEAEAEVTSLLFTEETADAIEKLAPFGPGNKKPQFVARDLVVTDRRAVGKDQDHAKFTFQGSDRQVDGIGFGLAGACVEAKQVDVLFHLEINEFRGRESVQLNVQDIAPAGEVEIRINDQ